MTDQIYMEQHPYMQILNFANHRMNEDAEVWYGRIKEVMTGLGEDVVKWETWKWANGVYHSRGEE